MNISENPKAPLITISDNWNRSLPSITRILILNKNIYSQYS